MFLSAGKILNAGEYIVQIFLKSAKKYEQKKYPERGSNPHDVAIGGF